MTLDCVGFIGLGLIGGSLAKRIRIVYPECKIVAFNSHKSNSFTTAKKEDVIDDILDDIKELKNCNIIFLCAPVMTNLYYLEQLKDVCNKDCIITDVGSVKNYIHDKVVKLDMEDMFIGGHPMAGSEKIGYSASKSNLFENAYYILTTTSGSDLKKAKKLKEFVTEIGALPLQLDSKEHDNCVAVVSHVPHVIAFALVRLLMKNDSSEETMKQIAAGGFRDITRIASSSPKVWEDICMANKEAICNYLDIFKSYVNDMQQFIINNDNSNLNDVFTESKNYRDSINSNKRGSLEKYYELYVDIVDKTGAIATVATILAKKEISILNIGIIHNREFEDGVLKISFHNKEALANAEKILKDCDYTIYDRT